MSAPPTRASLLTGKYPQRVGFTTYLKPDKRTDRPIADHMMTNYEGVLKIDGEVGIKKVYDPLADPFEKQNIASSHPEKPKS